MISDAKREKLKYCYRGGESMIGASKIAGVCECTVKRYFGIFAADGLQRGILKSRAAHAQTRWRVPRYTGPTWIGKAIDSESRI